MLKSTRSINRHSAGESLTEVQDEMPQYGRDSYSLGTKKYMWHTVSLGFFISPSTVPCNSEKIFVISQRSAQLKVMS